MSKSYGKKSVKFRSLQSQAKKWESFASNLPAPLDLEQSVLSESSASDTETLSDLHQIENLLASVAIGDISPEIPVSSAAAVHSKLSAVASDALEMKNFDYKTDLNVPIDALDALFKLCQQSETCQLLLDDPPSLKIGEATYSDVYLLDSDDLPFPQAVKVIPLGGTDQLSIEEAILELQSTLSVANIKKCRSDTAAFHFVQLCKCQVSCGPYDPNLLKLWDEYDQENESENVNPSEFPSDQIYLTLHMQFGGTDLEHTSIVTNQKRIRSILFQVILSVAQGEEQCQLEHRDLHWGNILIENSPDLKTLEYDFKENRISIQGANVKVVLIDFTLARMKSNDDTVVFNNLDDIEGLFDGTGEDEEDGDIQFDIYRWMKATTMSDWKGFHPKTNVHWIHYLLQKLKTFDIPFMPAKNMDLFQNRLRTEYESVSAIVLREMVNKTGIFTKHAVIIE